MNFLHQYLITIPFLVLLAAEAVKFTIDLIQNRAKRRFVNTGGMPSGHSAFVSSLVVVVAYREGIESTAFTIAAVLALVVMYDAINLRNEAGKHAAKINEHHQAELEESLGHNHLEVLVGAFFGVGLSIGLLAL